MVTREVLDLTYKMHVRPHLEYGDVLFHESSQELTRLIESVQNQAGLIVTGCWLGSNQEKVRKELGWESLQERRRFHRIPTFLTHLLMALFATRDPSSPTVIMSGKLSTPH